MGRGIGKKPFQKLNDQHVTLILTSNSIPNDITSEIKSVSARDQNMNLSVRNCHSYEKIQATRKE